MSAGAPSPPAEDRVFELGPFRLDVAERTLARPGRPPVQLTGRPLALLVHMLERPGRLLTKQELLDAVWNGVIVEEGSLAQAVSALRRALGERGGETRSIETVPGVGYRFVGAVRRIGPDAAAAPEPPSIAVLPFDDLSADGDQGYFADGVAEEILTRLAGVAGLRVIGRASSFVFRGRRESPQAIGAALGASRLLTGAVRKQGGRARITAQLVDAASGAQVWSLSFDRALGDTFAVQDEIAHAVAAAVELRLAGAQASVGGTTSAEAHDLYLRGRALTRRMSGPDAVRAAQLHREALALDPGFALAWHGLAETCRGAMILAPRDSERARETLAESVGGALAHAPGHWASHVAHSTKLYLDHDWCGYEAALRRAYALAPGQPVDLLFSDALFNAQVGRIGRACALQRRVVRDDPLSLLASNLLHLFLHTAEREADADAEYRRGRDLAGSRDVPEHTALQRAWAQGDERLIEERFALYLAHQTVPVPALRRVHEARGDRDAALAILHAAMDEPWAQAGTPMSILAWWLARYGDADAALAAATRAQTEMMGAAVSWLWLPCMKEVRRRPGFKALVVRLGLPDYWRASGDWGDFARPLGEGDFACL